MPSPIFILVPGSWHTTFHVQPLIRALQSKGHTLKAHQLYSNGVKPGPRPTFTDDVNGIYNAVDTELQAGKDVCLISHSYAGMPGLEALNRLVQDGKTEAGEGRGRLVRAVFLAAFNLPALDMNDILGPQNPDLHLNEETKMTSHANAHEHFYNDMSASDAQPFIDALVDQYCPFAEPVLSSDAWRKAPLYVFMCKRDQAVPPAMQESMWADFDIEWLDAGHNPFISQPDKFAEGLLRAAGEQ